MPLAIGISLGIRFYLKYLLSCDRRYESMPDFRGRPKITGNVRFGSQAALQSHSSPTAASGRIAVVRQPLFRSQVLNVCFHQWRSFAQGYIRAFDGPLTANSRPSDLFMAAKLSLLHRKDEQSVRRVTNNNIPGWQVRVYAPCSQIIADAAPR